jgi:hypothetical protein
MMTLDKLIDIVGRETGVNLRANTRKTDVVVARAIYYQLAHKDLRLASSSTIGESLGKDHATVLHGIKTHIPMLQTYFPSYYDNYLVLKQKLNVPSKKMTIKEKYYDMLIKYNKLLEIYGNDIQKHKRDIDSVSQESRICFVTYPEWKKQRIDKLYTERKRQDFKKRIEAEPSSDMLLGNLQQA